MSTRSQEESDPSGSPGFGCGQCQSGDDGGEVGCLPEPSPVFSSGIELGEKLAAFASYASHHCEVLLAEDYSEDYVRSSGCRAPVTIATSTEDAHLLGVKLEGYEDLTASSIESMVGGESELLTMDVTSQMDGPRWNLSQWCKYWQERRAKVTSRIHEEDMDNRAGIISEDDDDLEDEVNSEYIQLRASEHQPRVAATHRKNIGAKQVFRLLALTRLPIAGTKLSSLFELPPALQKVDLVKLVGYAEASLKPHQMIHLQMFPQKSFLNFQVEGCGAATWLHVLSGRLVLALIPPSVTNLSTFLTWHQHARQSGAFLPEFCSDVKRIEVAAGTSLIVPGGWVYGLTAIEDTIAVKCCYWHPFNLDHQALVYQMEEKLTTRQPSTACRAILWYSLWYYTRIVRPTAGLSAAKKVRTGSPSRLTAEESSLFQPAAMKNRRAGSLLRSPGKMHLQERNAEVISPVLKRPRLSQVDRKERKAVLVLGVPAEHVPEPGSPLSLERSGSWGCVEPVRENGRFGTQEGKAKKLGGPRWSPSIDDDVIVDDVDRSHLQSSCFAPGRRKGADVLTCPRETVGQDQGPGRKMKIKFRNAPKVGTLLVDREASVSAASGGGSPEEDGGTEGCDMSNEVAGGGSGGSGDKSDCGGELDWVPRGGELEAVRAGTAGIAGRWPLRLKFKKGLSHEGRVMAVDVSRGPDVEEQGNARPPQSPLIVMNGALPPPKSPLRIRVKDLACRARSPLACGARSPAAVSIPQVDGADDGPLEAVGDRGEGAMELVSSCRTNKVDPIGGDIVGGTGHRSQLVADAGPSGHSYKPTEGSGMTTMEVHRRKVARWDGQVDVKAGAGLDSAEDKVAVSDLELGPVVTRDNSVETVCTSADPLAPSRQAHAPFPPLVDMPQVGDASGKRRGHQVPQMTLKPPDGVELVPLGRNRDQPKRPVSLRNTMERNLAAAGVRASSGLVLSSGREEGSMDIPWQSLLPVRDGLSSPLLGPSLPGFPPLAPPNPLAMPPPPPRPDRSPMLRPSPPLPNMFMNVFRPSLSAPTSPTTQHPSPAVSPLGPMGYSMAGTSLPPLWLGPSAVKAEGPVVASEPVVLKDDPSTIMSSPQVGGSATLTVTPAPSQRVPATLEGPRQTGSGAPRGSSRKLSIWEEECLPTMSAILRWCLQNCGLDDVPHTLREPDFILKQLDEGLYALGLPLVLTPPIVDFLKAPPEGLLRYMRRYSRSKGEGGRGPYSLPEHLEMVEETDPLGSSEVASGRGKKRSRGPRGTWSVERGDVEARASAQVLKGKQEKKAKIKKGLGLLRK